MGRDVDEEVGRVEDSCMSRTHFRVAYDGRSSGYWFGDANSRNGVASASGRLAPGDVLRAGDSLFVFTDDDRMKKLEDELSAAARSELTT